MLYLFIMDLIITITKFIFELDQSFLFMLISSLDFILMLSFTLNQNSDIQSAIIKFLINY